MNKIKKFHSFNEGFEKISDYLNRVLKRGGDFASDVWVATKRESQETKMAVEILGRMIKGEEVTDKEKEFVKKQSGDVVRILPLVAISGLPIPIPITPLLIMLGKKYGFDFLPKDHREILSNQVELPKEVSQYIQNLPENGMGYHIVDLLLKNGRVLSGRKIINSTKLILNPDESIDTDEIDTVVGVIE
jgi:hypothetical protein